MFLALRFMNGPIGSQTAEFQGPHIPHTLGLRSSRGVVPESWKELMHERAPASWVFRFGLCHAMPCHAYLSVSDAMIFKQLDGSGFYVFVMNSSKKWRGTMSHVRR